MDLDTFLTTLYVWIDDWYKAEMAEVVQRHKGPPPKMSDSEVLTGAIAGQWRYGTPWCSERGVVRYMLGEGREWFPNMLQRSRFNERVRCLWGVIIQVQQALTQQLEIATDALEIVDCFPLPSCSNAQSHHARHWLWWGTRGHGGTHGTWYWGDQVIMSITPTYLIKGWLLGPANVDDRAMLQALIGKRHAELPFKTPIPWRPGRQMNAPAFALPTCAVGATNRTNYYLADKGFNGYRWQQHWYTQYGVSVVTEPARNAHGVKLARSWRRWFRSIRQRIETTFAVLTTVFAIKHLQAHSRWGQITRLALATAAYSWGIWLNRRMGRPDLSHATLL